MVKLLEHKGKTLLKTSGIPTPRGEVARAPQEARAISDRLGCPVMLKAQVLAGGRFKAGGVKTAHTPEEAETTAALLFGSKIKGFKVTEILVEEKLPVKREFYIGIVVNDSWKIRSPVMIFSTEGGVDIEEVARKTPEKVAKMAINILEGVGQGAAEQTVLKLGLGETLAAQVGRLLGTLYRTFRRYEARALEINPLGLTEDGKLTALDCRFIIDDSAVPRHPELEIEIPRDSESPFTPLDKLAWNVEEGDYRGVAYFTQLTPEIREKGYIGFHGIGGGGAMIGFDALQRNGLKIADYADTSGNPTAAKVYRIAKIILSQPGIEGYFLSGAVIASQEQWHHAHGLVKAFREMLVDTKGFPVVMLIAGNKENEAIKILKEGLQDLPIKMEVYGRDHVYKIDYLAQRMKQLTEKYRRQKGELQ